MVTYYNFSPYEFLELVSLIIPPLVGEEAIQLLPPQKKSSYLPALFSFLLEINLRILFDA